MLIVPNPVVKMRNSAAAFRRTVSRSAPGPCNDVLVMMPGKALLS